MKKVSLVICTLIMSCNGINTIQNSDSKQVDSLVRISDSLVQSMTGFSYLKLGEPYKDIVLEAKRHHKPYLRLFKRALHHASDYDMYEYGDDYSFIMLGDVLLSKKSTCSKYGFNSNFSENTDVSEANGAIMFSENIIVEFDLLFFQDSLCKIRFHANGLDFAKKAIETKYGIGHILSNTDKPGIKTDIVIVWENECIYTRYNDYVSWKIPQKKIDFVDKNFIMQHKELMEKANASEFERENEKKKQKNKEFENAIKNI